MTSNNLHRDLEQALENVDEDFIDALIEALESDPEAVRAALQEYGYLINREEEDQREQDIRNALTASEQQLLSIVETLGTPRSTEQIMELIQREHEEFTKNFRSAGDRSWINKKLNNLVKQGLVGKFREGRTVRYTSQIEEAVRHWALHNNRFVEDLSRTDVDEIVAETGMPREKVRRAIKDLTETDN